MNILVTGGAGFIGSAYVRHRLETHPDFSVRVLDKLTYAGRRENLEGLDESRLELVVADIVDAEAVKRAIDGCDAIVNFAAETHVDRSIEAPGEFIQTDVFGTYVLLEAAREAQIRHLQISTDEVYGSIDEGTFTESSPIDPSSPYSASKAGGDMMVGAYRNTYGSDALIVRASNNYGPRQYPEKLIPLCILNALAGESLPVYGDGMQVRNWLWVDDFASAIDIVLESGEPGEVYNVGGPDEKPNIEVVTPDPRAHRPRRVADLIRRPTASATTAATRCPAEKTEGLGWKAAIGFDEGIERTVAWYRDNEWWWKPILSGEYASTTTAGTAVDARSGSRPASTASCCSSRRSTATSAAFWSRPSAPQAWREAGVDCDFVQDNHSRSVERHPSRPSLPARAPARRSWSAACAAGSGTSPSTCAAARRPSASGRATSSTTSCTASCSCPGGFAHGFCVLSEIADVHYKLSAYYDPATEAGIAWDDPTVAVEWPISDPQVSERDATAPKLSEIEDELDL